LSAFEGMSRAALQHAFAHVQRLRNPFAGGVIPPWTLLVELSRNSTRQEGEPPLDEQLQEMLARLSDGDNPALSDAVFAPAESLWAIRHSLSEGLRASGSVIGFDLSFKRTTVMRFRRAAAAMLARDFPELELCDFGHVGDGGIHFNLLLPAGQPLSAGRRAALREAVLDLAINEFHGTFSGEHGVGRSNQDAYDRFTPAPVQALSAGLVELFSRSVPAAVRFGTKTA
jgi:FAD/FMN-containing dehydrogenase